MNIIRVLVADAHPIARAGLRVLAGASQGMGVIGEAGDGPSAVRLTSELDPDVVVTEATLPGLAGAEFVKRVCDGRPDRKVLVFTACEDGEALRVLLAVGAVGCVLKQATAEELVRAVQAVASGAIYLDPTAAVAIGSAPPTTALAGDLSDREQEVVRRLALGYSNKEVAARLKLSVKTIEVHKARALEKLHLGSRVELVRYAARRGWLADAEVSTSVLTRRPIAWGL